MTEQYAALVAANQALGDAPASTVPPPGQWTEQELLAVIEQERSSRVQLEQALHAERTKHEEELLMWDEHCQGLEQVQSQTQAQMAEVQRQSQVQAAEMHSRHEQITELQRQSQAQLAELEHQSHVQIAEVQRQSQVQIAEVQRQAQAASMAPAPLDLDAEFAEPTSSKGVSTGAVVGLVLLLAGGAAGAYFGVLAPRIAGAEATAARMTLQMQNETRLLRDKLDAQRSTSGAQVADLNRELSAARANGGASTASATGQSSTPKPPTVGVSAAAKPKAKRMTAQQRRARANRAKRAKRARAKRARAARARAKRKSRSASAPNDPIAGL